MKPYKSTTSPALLGSRVWQKGLEIARSMISYPGIQIVSYSQNRRLQCPTTRRKDQRVVWVACPRSKSLRSSVISPSFPCDPPHHACHSVDTVVNSYLGGRGQFELSSRGTCSDLLQLKLVETLPHASARPRSARAPRIGIPQDRAHLVGTQGGREGVRMSRTCLFGIRTRTGQTALGRERRGTGRELVVWVGYLLR